jgi:hypothetical protein
MVQRQCWLYVVQVGATDGLSPDDIDAADALFALAQQGTPQQRAAVATGLTQSKGVRESSSFLIISCACSALLYALASGLCPWMEQL